LFIFNNEHHMIFEVWWFAPEHGYGSVTDTRQCCH